MAVYNPLPTFPISGQAVDANNNNVFTWEFQSSAGETQNGYQLKIYNLSNTLIYDSGSIASVYGYHTVPMTILTNGTTYKWKVIVDGSHESQMAVINALATPTVTIDTLPNPFIYQFYDFYATYSQAQSVPVKEFEWKLYNNSDVLLKTSGIIIGRIPYYQFDDLADDTTYKVEVTVRNQAEYVVTSSKVTFTTDYTKPYAPESFTVQADNEGGANVLDWSSVVAQVGTVTGTYQFVTGEWGYALHLDSGSVLEYDLNVDLPEMFSSVLFLKLGSGFSGDIFRFFKNGEIEYRIGYDLRTSKFYYERGKRRTTSMTAVIPSDFFRFIIKDNYIAYEISGTHILR